MVDIVTWNYRVVRRKYKDGHEELSIYSVYYDKDGHVQGMSKDPAHTLSYSLEGLEEEMERMRMALSEPILDYED